MKITQSHGFTIIELLVVMIVIGILTTIITVGYQGTITTSRAKAAESSASVVQKKLESYYSAKGSYPNNVSVDDFVTALNSLNDSALNGTGVTLVKQVDSTTGQKSVQVSRCTGPSDAAAATAYKIEYWDYTKNQLSTNAITSSVGVSCTTWDPLH